MRQAPVQAPILQCTKVGAAQHGRKCKSVKHLSKLENPEGAAISALGR